MTDFYSLQQQGVADGTVVPANRADGRKVGAKRRTILASNPLTTALAAADRMYLGRLKAGEKPIGFRVTSDTSLATTTFSVGTTAAATKWVNAKAPGTLVNVSQPFGPLATTLDDDPVSADEDMWLTIGTTTIASGVFFTVEVEIAAIG